MPLSRSRAHDAGPASTRTGLPRRRAPLWPFSTVCRRPFSPARHAVRPPHREDALRFSGLRRGRGSPSSGRARPRRRTEWHVEAATGRVEGGRAPISGWRARDRYRAYDWASRAERTFPCTFLADLSERRMTFEADQRNFRVSHLRLEPSSPRGPPGSSRNMRFHIAREHALLVTAAGLTATSSGRTRYAGRQRQSSRERRSRHRLGPTPETARPARGMDRAGRAREPSDQLLPLGGGARHRRRWISTGRHRRPGLPVHGTDALRLSAPHHQPEQEDAESLPAEGDRRDRRRRNQRRGCRSLAVERQFLGVHDHGQRPRRSLQSDL